MNISQNGLELIKSYEGCRLKAYKCPAGVWTIGYGSTLNVSQGQIITAKQAEELLLLDLKRFEEGVNALELNLTQGQYDALVSFAFNLGIQSLRNSTLLRKLRDGDVEGAAKEFARWNRAGGRVMLGLVARRASEKRLFLS